jgi:HD superfamily phosphohydrolase
MDTQSVKNITCPSLGALPALFLACFHAESNPRLIKSARVIENQICYDIKDANQIYELCYTRFSFHKRIYNHKTGRLLRDLPYMRSSSSSTAKAIEYMIVDGLLAADPYMHIAEQVDKPKKYVYLTDDIMPRIESTTEPVS